MMVLLQGVLEQADVARVCEGVRAAPQKDGRATAGPTAAKVKANRQADGADPAVQALERFVHTALCRHPTFLPAVRPKLISRLLFSRYGPAEAYGRHTDDAVMGAADSPLRTDVAFTLFLADPATYEGGELVIEGPAGAQAIKLAAGDAVVYPAGTIHQVNPVTEGERVAAVGWAQSQIRDPIQRELLFDLTQARAALASGDVDGLLRLDRVIGGLLRQWAEI